MVYTNTGFHPSHLNESKATLDPIETRVDPVYSHRLIGYLHFQISDTLHQFQNTLVQGIELYSNRPQMLDHDIVRFCHGGT
jgi:hypothetical protein